LFTCFISKKISGIIAVFFIMAVFAYLFSEQTD